MKYMILFDLMEVLINCKNIFFLHITEMVLQFMKVVTEATGPMSGDSRDGGVLRDITHYLCNFVFQVIWICNFLTSIIMCKYLFIVNIGIMVNLKVDPVPEGDEVVISGISGRFPSARNVDELRDKLFNKDNLVGLREETFWNDGKLAYVLY